MRQLTGPGGQHEAAQAAPGVSRLLRRHPDGATQLVRSALTAFAADARWHDRHGPCHGVGRAPLLPVPSDEEREWGWT